MLSSVRGHTILGDPTNIGSPENLGGIYPDYVTIAQGFGVKARRVVKREELREAIQEMLDHDGPYLLDVIRNTIDTADLDAIHARQRKMRDDAWEYITKAPFIRRLMIRHWVRESARGAALREQAKSVAVKVMEPLKAIFTEAARRFVGRGLHSNSWNIPCHPALIA